MIGVPSPRPVSWLAPPGSRQARPLALRHLGPPPAAGNLCLSPQRIQEGPLLKECVSAYIECLGKHSVSRPDWAKRRLQAYLASQPRPGLLLGQAAEAGYWHFEDPVWAPLKQFLRDLAGET